MRKRRLLIGVLGAAFFSFAGGNPRLGPIPLLPGGPSQAWALAGEAEFIGTEDCLDCHEEYEQAWADNVHSRTSSWGWDAIGCEGCHGPGSIHAESEGEVELGGPATLETADANAACLTCHDGGLGQRYWQGSAHESTDLSCVSCHSIHSNFKSLLNSRSEAFTCFECHPEQRTFLFKRSSHPMTDSSRRDGTGKMRCSSCHNAHGTQSDKLIAANSVNDKCYECHREMQAPVLWEHSPVKESCLNCHKPHGSNYENLLAYTRTRLCQACHEAGRHQTVAGQTRSFLVLNRQCSNCHAQVHGSNHPSGLKLKR
jgi:DmsE family decaheme c-type cytochrome